MKLPQLNDEAGVRERLVRFERRFVQTPAGVIYLPGETGTGVKLPVDVAASLIAGMRATMVEVDRRQPWSGQDAIFAAVALMCVTIMIGAITGFDRIAAALMIPIALGSIVLGPLLGVIRTQLAWHRGIREAERRMEPFERLAADATRQLVKPNPFLPVFVVTATLSVAVIAGLMFASATSPTYVAAAIDRFGGNVVGIAVLAVIGLSFAFRAVDAYVRTPVSEAEVRLALHERQQRPLTAAAPAPAPAPRARPAAMRYGNKRRR